ncbi:MAG: hypothetical protein IMZ53_06675 [Thermoplasmata archaeon]|nr:hypothetical protein [Thermoplasmata archaeon]
MSKPNYCYDKCKFNLGVTRRSIQDGKELITIADTGKNKKLNCDLGYSQTVNSQKALINSQSQGTRLCPSLRKLFGREEK